MANLDEITHARLELESGDLDGTYNLARSLMIKVMDKFEITDMDEAISLYRSALDLFREDDDRRPHALSDLALCLHERYKKLDTIADLEEAIEFDRAALDLRPLPHPHHCKSLINLAIHLTDRFLEKGLDDDIDEAISLYRSVLGLRLVGHPRRFNSIRWFSFALWKRYLKRGTKDDLKEAKDVLREICDDPPCHNDPLYYLAETLKDRFLEKGVDSYLDDAISLHRFVLDLLAREDPDRLTSLNQLADCLSSRFEKREMEADLDELITLCRFILDLYPPGHTGHTTSHVKLLLYVRRRTQRFGELADLDECILLGQSALALPGILGRTTHLHNLITDLHERFHKLKLEQSPGAQGARFVHTASFHNLIVCVREVVDGGDADADEIVSVSRTALSLCPSGHPDYFISLTTLAASLRCRIQQQDTIADLNEAINLYKKALGISPKSGDPAYASLMHELACCLRHRYSKLSTAADLDDAIKFAKAALDLCPPGHRDHGQLGETLADCRELKHKSRGSISSSSPSTRQSASSLIKKRMDVVIFEVLNGLPLRLLDTHTCMLCDRGSQISRFEKSQEYEKLLSAASAGTLLEAELRSVVATYFRYATLSHRWGKTEPLLRDIDGRAIDNLGQTTDGVAKLQSFCIASCRHGLLWAWSDTCCIDKESSAELQEAIASMFSWYCKSSLTIVHLADVSDTGSLISSEWFKRGWTLQELLAPRNILFFTQDWTVYRAVTSNHKENSTIIGELEKATGIASCHLINFRPGVTGARSKLQWASKRCTTRPEDMAYSLFGIFDIHLPIMYGESAEKALGRLLAEVIKLSGDTTILAWEGRSSRFHSCFPPTIDHYQTVTSSQSTSTDFAPSTRIAMSWNPFDSRLRKMREELSRLNSAQFIGFKLHLPCIVHRIKTITSTRADRVYRVLAEGLIAIEVVLSTPLQNIPKPGPVPYVLIRPLLGQLSVTDHNSLTQLVRPFDGLLLQKSSNNEYRRVASLYKITACPTNCAGVLRGKVMTLRIE